MLRRFPAIFHFLQSIHVGATHVRPVAIAQLEPMKASEDRPSQLFSVPRTIIDIKTVMDLSVVLWSRPALPPPVPDHQRVHRRTRRQCPARTRGEESK